MRTSLRDIVIQDCMILISSLLNRFNAAYDEINDTIFVNESPQEFGVISPDRLKYLVDMTKGSDNYSVVMYELGQGDMNWRPHHLDGNTLRILHDFLSELEAETFRSQRTIH